MGLNFNILDDMYQPNSQAQSPFLQGTGYELYRGQAPYLPGNSRFS